MRKLRQKITDLPTICSPSGFQSNKEKDGRSKEYIFPPRTLGAGGVGTGTSSCTTGSVLPSRAGWRGTEAALQGSG